MSTTSKSTPPDKDESILNLRVENIAELGETKAHYKGAEVSIFGGIPGEEVEVTVLREANGSKKAIVTKVINPSPLRVTPTCKYFGSCTGCQWQHINYKGQLKLKQDIVKREINSRESLQDIRVLPTLPSPEKLGYRNHARFTGRRNKQLGFVNRITKQFVRIDKCQLMHESINNILKTLQERVSGISQISIRHGINTKSELVQPKLLESNLDIKSGQKEYFEKLLGRTFEIASPSFFQVNTHQTEKMANFITDNLNLSGSEIIVDAYAGVGTFAILLSKYAKRIIAVEESISAVRNAEKNIEINNINNIEIAQGRTENILTTIDEPVDIVILDPPRTGCHIGTLKGLLNLGIPKVVYISCDPPSLARDLELLVNNGYIVDLIQPIDMFPQTHHVECVTILSINAGTDMQRGEQS